jgi:tetracycline 7-halogenase / FADH2 O2-dependent halogenase
MLMLKCDLAIVGSGFGGSIMAMIARRLGHSVVLLERGRHPRFAIGESSTPLANLLLEELARRYELPRLLPLCKWGSWQKTYPDAACGLKRGFTFYQHTFGKPFGPDPERQKQLLVGASARDEVADTHWYRPDFDRLLADQAQEQGALFFDETELGGLRLNGDEVQISGTSKGEPMDIRARFMVDASGPRGFLHRAFDLGESAFENLPHTHGLFSHFRNVRRLDSMDEFATKDTPPFPVDDAAVHHLFDGGWIWVLRFNNGITSAGVAATNALAKQLQFEQKGPAWERLLDLLPSVRAQFHESESIVPFVHAPKLAFRTATVTGSRWALLPSTAGFVDPLLSTGFALNLLGISRLGRAIEFGIGTNNFHQALRDYSEQTMLEIKIVEKLVAALYASMGDMSLFSPLSLLYFAAVSFTETNRRLGRAQCVPGFLHAHDERFQAGLEGCCRRAVQSLSGDESAKSEFVSEIRRVIEPLDVAGLNDTTRRSWHPVIADDLRRAGPKLQASVAELERLISRNL